MVKDCLLEIGVEELPYSSQKLLLLESEIILSNILKKNNIQFSSIKFFVTPCRIVLKIYDVLDLQLSDEKELLGPPKQIAYDINGNPTKVLFGFMQKFNVSEENLIEKETDKGIYLAVKIKSISSKTIDVLPLIFKEFISSIPFSKMMIWNESRFKFIRPIRWVLALFGNELIEFNIAEVNVSKYTYLIGGYRGEKVEVSDINQYFEIMNSNEILLNYGDRKEQIKRDILDVIVNVGEIDLSDDGLLDEVTALVETPSAILCSFDSLFLHLPFEVVATVLRHHQKCFAVYKNNNLTNHFVFICNGKNKNIPLVRAGYEKVVRARLSDADFFFDEDKKIGFASLTNKLQKVVYQEKLGSIYDKLGRIQKISDFLIADINNQIGNSINDGMKLDIKNIILLSKNDLLTDMVGEFPELQGIMGKYYAQNQGYADNISKSIEEHYLPRFRGDKLPSLIESSIVSILDKIDNIISTFLLDKKPTGSKDPFGIRRQISGIMNILKNRRWDIDLFSLLSNCAEIFNDKFEKEKINAVVKDLKEFFAIRLENYLLEEGFRIDVIRSVTFGKNNCNICSIYNCAEFVTECLKQDIFLKIIEVYKRANNILKKSNISFESINDINVNFLKLDEEKNLYKSIKDFEFELPTESNIKMYQDLKVSLDLFFENVVVMDDDLALRNNRLLLLNILVSKFKRVADLSEIILD